MNTTLTAYYNNTIQTCGEAAEEAKNLRNNPNFLQKTFIQQKSLIDLFNFHRMTSQLTKLTKALPAAFMFDFEAIFPTMNSLYKPYNVNTIHAPELTDRLENAGIDQAVAQEAVAGMMKGLSSPSASSDKTRTSKFGYSTEAEFKAVLKREFLQDYSSEVDSVEVPLKGESWFAWLTTHAFNVVTALTVVDFLRSWDLLDTGRIAAKIGSFKGFEFVEKLSFPKIYNISLNVAFFAFFLESLRQVRAASGTLLSNGQDEEGIRRNAKLALITSFFESLYFGYGTLSMFGVVNANVGISALGALAAKSFGQLMIAKFTYNPADRVPVAEKGLYEKTKNAILNLSVVKFFTESAPYVWVASKIHAFVTIVLEALNDTNSLVHDGTDKFYKSFLPKLKLVDLLLVKNGQGALFTKMRETLDFHKRLIYVSKIFGTLSNWIKPNGLKIPENSLKGWKEGLLDLANVLDFLRFFREYDLIGYNKLVEIGTKWSKIEVSVSGKSFVLDDVPILREIWHTPKNIPVVIASALELWGVGREAKTIGFRWRTAAEEAKNEKWYLTSQAINVLKVVTEIGKLTIISLYSRSRNWQVSFAILESTTGDAGFARYLLEQYKGRRRFSPDASVAAADPRSAAAAA